MKAKMSSSGEASDEESVEKEIINQLAIFYQKNYLPHSFMKAKMPSCSEGGYDESVGKEN